MNLKEGGLVPLSNNKTYIVHGIKEVRLKMFDNYDLILYNKRYAPGLKKILFSISMFEDLGYFTRAEYDMLKISLGALIIAKGPKM